MPRLLSASRMLCALVFLFGLVAVAGASSVQERVAIPAEGASSSPAPLVGWLNKPAGSGPFQAIVLMHGCGGAYGRDGGLGPRHKMWSEFLAASGYMALMLDSFTSRGIKELCTVKFSDRTIREADRIGDAHAALAFLRGRSDVLGGVAILGWSHGGGTVLSTITSSKRPVPGFNAAIAFYPGCTARSKAPEKFRPYAPLLLLIGESDDWTPAAPCKSLAAAVAARGEPMRIVTYPDSYHDFDNPGITTTRVRTEVPNGVNPGKGVTVGPNPIAREDSKKEVLRFLVQNLK